MNKLNENQIAMSKNYLDLINTIEEGFQYVIESFQNLERTEGDQVLSDILVALNTLGESQFLFSKIFHGQHFDGLFGDINVVINKALQLEGNLNNPEQKQKIIETSIYPAFKNWKMEIQQVLTPYVQN
jgi:hypothetical protein